MFKKKLYSIFLRLVHLIFDMIDSLYGWSKQLRSVYSHQRSPLTINRLRDAIYPNVNNIPTHVGFIISSDQIDGVFRREKVINQLAQLVCWSLLLDIKCITIYDYDGIFISKKKDLEIQISKYISEFEQRQLGKGSEKRMNVKNGFSKPCLVLNIEPDFSCSSKIRFLSGKDSREAIVTAAQTLIADRIKKTNATIKPKDITETLRKDFNFPDPDLLINLDSTSSLFGYPLWQIRLTEILPLEMASTELTIDDFINVLLKYERCTKRFGT